MDIREIMEFADEVGVKFTEEEKKEIERIVDTKELLERCYGYLERLPCYDNELKKDLDSYFWGESEE